MIITQTNNQANKQKSKKKKKAKKKQNRICNKQTCICVVKFATVSAKR